MNHNVHPIVAWPLAAMVFLTFATLPAVAAAEEGDEADLEFEYGVTAGGNWNILTQPEDPEGDFTFLWGSAFTGFGGVIGATVATDVAEFDSVSLMVTADALYGYHRGTGFADHGDAGRIDVTLTSHVLRLPVLARFYGDAADLRPSFGLGVEPILGIASSSRTAEHGIEGEVEDVDTSAGSGLAGIAAAGLEFDTDEGHPVLFDLRFSWNPFVSSSTEERFDGFESEDDPGVYRVAYDWQVFVTAGVRWD